MVAMTEAVWRCRDRAFPLGERTLLMGVVNVTPDSFSDGGRFLHPDDAVKHAMQLAADGADILDVGGESTRPGAEPVSLDEEVRPRGARDRAPAAEVPEHRDQHRHAPPRSRPRGARRGRRHRERRHGGVGPRYVRGGAGVGCRTGADAHAGRTADDAGRPHLRRRRRRGARLPRRTDRGRRVRPVSPATASASTPGSVSGRRPRTTSRCCATSCRSGGSLCPCWSA